MEMNPDNPTTAAARDHWHAIMTLVMIKQGLTEILITADDIENMRALPETPVIMLHDGADGLRIKLISQDEAAMLLAREQIGSQS